MLHQPRGGKHLLQAQHMREERRWPWQVWGATCAPPAEACGCLPFSRFRHTSRWTSNDVLRTMLCLMFYGSVGRICSVCVCVCNYSFFAYGEGALHLYFSSYPHISLIRAFEFGVIQAFITYFVYSTYLQLSPYWCFLRPILTFLLPSSSDLYLWGPFWYRGPSNTFKVVIMSSSIS